MARFEYISTLSMHVKHNSIMYKMIALSISKNRAMKQAKETWRVTLDIARSGPYESKYFNESISGLIEEYGKILNMFSHGAKNKNSESLSEKIEELEDISKII